MQKSLTVSYRVSGAGILSAQTTLTNSDLVKMSKAGLSEDFITNLIDQQGSRLASYRRRLSRLKTKVSTNELFPRL